MVGLTDILTDWPTYWFVNWLIISINGSVYCSNKDAEHSARLHLIGPTQNTSVNFHTWRWITNNEYIWSLRSIHVTCNLVSKQKRPWVFGKYRWPMRSKQCQQLYQTFPFIHPRSSEPITSILITSPICRSLPKASLGGAGEAKVSAGLTGIPILGLAIKDEWMLDCSADYPAAWLDVAVVVGFLNFPRRRVRMCFVFGLLSSFVREQLWPRHSFRITCDMSVVSLLDSGD